MSGAVKEEILCLEREQVRAVNRGDVPGATRMFVTPRPSPPRFLKPA